MRRTPKISLIGLLTAVTMAAASGAFAATAFTDNPPGTYYYDAVRALDGAGITSGSICGGTAPTYCPEQLVNRAQMAAFLERALPVTAQTSRMNVTSFNYNDDSEDIMSVTIKVPGSGTEATQYVLVQGLAEVVDNVGTTGATCPCSVNASLAEQGATDSPPTQSTVDWGNNNGAASDRTQISARWLFKTTPGTHRYTLRMSVGMRPTTGQFTVLKGHLTATTSPFGSTDYVPEPPF